MLSEWFLYFVLSAPKPSSAQPCPSKDIFSTSSSGSHIISSSSPNFFVCLAVFSTVWSMQLLRHDSYPSVLMLCPVLLSAACNFLDTPLGFSSLISYLCGFIHSAPSTGNIVFPPTPPLPPFLGWFLLIQAQSSSISSGKASFSSRLDQITLLSLFAYLYYCRCNGLLTQPLDYKDFILFNDCT